MIVSDQELLNYLQFDGTDEEALIVLAIKKGAESWISQYCNRTFEAGSYREYIDGRCSRNIFLKNTPITAIKRIVVGRNNGMTVKNTAAYTQASVSVSPTAVTLYKDGSVDSTITLGTSAISDIVSAINNVSGWSAEACSPYGSYKATELIEAYGLNAIDSNIVYLEVPSIPEYNTEVYLDRGLIVLNTGTVKGRRQVIVEYSGGYELEDMPQDLQLAVKILTKVWNEKRKEDSVGTTSYSVADFQVNYESFIPMEVLVLLMNHRRIIAL